MFGVVAGCVCVREMQREGNKRQRCTQLAQLSHLAEPGAPTPRDAGHLVAIESPTRCMAASTEPPSGGAPHNCFLLCCVSHRCCAHSFELLTCVAQLTSC